MSSSNGLRKGGGSWGCGVVVAGFLGWWRFKEEWLWLGFGNGSGFKRVCWPLGCSGGDV